MALPLGPTGTAGDAPVGSASRSPLALFVALCLGLSVLLHAEPLTAAAAELHLQPGVVAGVALAVAALFNLAILSLNFLVSRRPAAGAGGPTPLLHPAVTAGTAPVPTASASTTPIAPFMGLCLAMSGALHAEPLVDAAAAVYQTHPAVVVCVLLSVAALFNWAIISLNFRLARRPAAGAGGPTPLLHPTGTAGEAPTGSASTYPIAPFMGLCIAMSVALHAEPLMDAAAEYQIHPVIVVGVVLAGAALFHLAILSVHKSLARRQAELPRSQGLPLLPFLVLALTIPTVSSAETVIAAGATDLAQSASVWALLALSVSFNIAVGSLYCIVINGRTPPTIAGVKMRPRSEAACAISCIITAGVLVSCMLLASGAASGAIATRR